MKSFIISIILLSTVGLSHAQELIPDPVKAYKTYTESFLSLGLSRVNTNAAFFLSEQGPLRLSKGTWLPTVEGGSTLGWIHPTAQGTHLIETGLHILARHADGKDTLGNTLRLTTGYLQIPFMFGYRSPLRYRTMKNGLYRAIESMFGFYVSTPFIQGFDRKENIDSKADILGFNYLKGGIMVDFAFTALNEKGYGHKVGVRISSDFQGMVKLRDTDAKVYPYYHAISLYYGLSNGYRK